MVVEEPRKSVTFSEPIVQNSGYPNNVEAMAISISNILYNYSRNDTISYYTLVHDLEKDNLSQEQLLLVLVCLSNQISSLSETMNHLVNALLKLAWLKGPLTKPYCHLLLNLVSAHATFASPICLMLISHLSNGTSHLDASLKPSVLFEYVHSTLAKLLKLVPTGPMFLLPILTAKYPHKTSPLDMHFLYVKSLLEIMGYVPVLQKQILNLILDGMVQIDVEIQIELEDLEEHDLEAIEKLVSKVHDLDLISSLIQGEDSMDEVPDYTSESSDDEDAFSIHSCVISSDAIDMVKKLDSLMTLLIHYFKTQSEKASQKSLSNLYQNLLDGFNKILLPTHRLRCSQYLVFFTSSLDPKFSEQFLSLLISRTLSDTDSPVLRVSASAYLASYVARSKFLPIHFVQLTLKLLNQFAQRYLDTCESSLGLKVDPEAHPVFYAVSQAILYIYCFRWKEIQMRDKNPLISQFAPELVHFQRVLVSKLVPLRVCSQPIVEQFAKITLRLDILYCYSLMAPMSATPPPDMARTSSRNSDHSIASTTRPPSLTNLIERLDSFFPFDPLCLPRSRLFINGLYIEWESDESEQGSETSDVDDLVERLFDDQESLSDTDGDSIN